MMPVQASLCLDRVRLKDGTTVGIRPLETHDRGALTSLYDRLSQRTRYHRFFACPARVPAPWADILLDLAAERRLGLVAEIGGEPHRIVAIADCTISPDREFAEVGLLVEDAWQERGLGRVLFERLIAWGERTGVGVFVAYVHWDNRRMIEALNKLTTILDRRLDGGVLKFTFARTR